MLVIYPFSIVDEQLALKNAQWIAELGKYKSHDIFILSDRRCNPQLMDQVVKTFTGVFRITKHRLTQADMDGWPEGANQLFSLATILIQHSGKDWPYFLWLEPDAIPMVPGWLDALEAEYKRAGKLFMGDRVQVNDIPLHMSGVGFYPNPIVYHAGECCRAHDIAWDMAAKDQIIPKAHFTDLIEHAWKHPTFKDQFELNTQIAKETILFHSSKDGSLIDRIREKAASVHYINSVATEPTSGMSSREEIGTRPAQPSPELIHDIVIRTYPGDYQWLQYCLQSIWQNVSGFRKIWIVSPAPAPDWFNKPLTDGVEWKVMNDETEDGYLAQQITKLYADVFTDYQADYILHVDSDIVFTRPTTPGDFFKDGKMIWYYTPYEAIQTPWQPITEKFMGFPMPFEFMRRLPMMVPRWLYSKLREFAFHLHGRPISEYVKTQPHRAFSEFNAMGAFAYFHHKDKFHFQDTQEEGMLPAPLARQFHSWSGITPEVKDEIETILGSGVSPAPLSQIKELPNGIWVLHGDQISEWVEQEGRLDHDQNFLPHILRHIRPGDTVVDAGAFIGDHTLAYSDAVGKHGLVLAYEPNPTAFKCLEHNIKDRYNVVALQFAIGETSGETIPLSGNNGNWGGCYAGEHMKISDAATRSLDQHLGNTPIQFIKIDVEGYESKVLKGAERVIMEHKPIMVIEINSEALARQDTNPGAVLSWIENHGYTYSIIQENCGFTDPLYDILCLPAANPPENSRAAFAHDSTAPAPVAPPISGKEEVKLYIDRLARFAGESLANKSIVMQRLVYSGLKKPHQKKIHALPNPFAPIKKRRRKRKQPPKEHPA